MPSTRYKINEKVRHTDLIYLYTDAGWDAYTAHPDTLIQAVQNSLFTVAACDGERMVGLLRAVGDGLTIVYIQDILVLKEYRRKGIGRELLRITLQHYASVRQIVMLTDQQAETMAFYKDAGLKEAEALELKAFVRIKT